MNILLLKGYNNYFNRILKKEASLAAYKSAVAKDNYLNYVEMQSVNFNPNDGVTTELIVGKGDLIWEEKAGSTSTSREGPYSPDYCIVYETVDSNTVIHSRWFVLECERTRGGQYRIALKRDVLVDYESDIMSAPCFVEKGTITDASDPLLFNSEGMSFNQIKKDELPLKDETKCAWLVGYLKKDITTPPHVTYTPADAMDDTVSIDSFDWYSCITYRDVDGTVTQGTKTFFHMNPDTSNFYWKMQVPGNSWPRYVDTAIKLRWDLRGQNRGYSYDIWNGDYQGMSQEAMIITCGYWSMGIDSPWCKRWSDDIINKMLGEHWDLFTALKNDAISQLSSYVVSDNVNNILNYNGKYFRKADKIYQLTIGPGNAISPSVQYNGQSTVANALWNCVLPDSRDTGNGVMTLNVATANPTKPRAKFIFQGLEYSIVAQEVLLPGTIDFTLSAESNRNNVEDAVYNMFAMPVMPEALGITSEVNHDGARMKIVNGNTQLYIDTMSRNNLAVATELCTALGGNSSASSIYDLQLLPYCPMTLPVSGTAIDISGLTVNKDYQYIQNTNSVIKGIIFFPDKANFSKNIDLTIPNEHIEYNSVRTFTNPVFHTIVTNWPNQGDIAKDEEGNPMLWWTCPLKSANAYDDPAVYDAIQTLPTGLINDGAPDGVGFNLVVSNADGTVTVYFSYDRTKTPWPTSKTYTGDLTIQLDWIIPDNNMVNADGALDIKVKNECDFERIVSPNFNGMFEFKKCRLNDGIHYINIDCTYKPYIPYIKLNPDFSGLYGQDWNDSTGLICGGDFSIPMMNDAFVNYELQNKNYQNIFNRQIENLDVNQQIAKEQQQFQGVIGAVTGGIGGAGAGAIAGLKVGGPWGAVAGAVAGGVGGTAAGIIGYNKDKDWLERAQGEARQYSIDQFNYQLGNIKAIPQSMTKSSPLSFNNKVWPILEFFSCTDREKEVLKDKIKYDGMTIMAVGTIADYLATGGYVKGKLIRLPNLMDDFHVADAIYQEVDKGFYEGE